MSDVPPQPRYLTLIELVLNFGLYGGIGYLVAGQTGLWCGVGLIAALYGRAIWLSARPSSDRRVALIGTHRPDERPDPDPE